MSTWSVLLWNFLPWKNTELNSSRVFAEAGFFLPVPKHRFSQAHEQVASVFPASVPLGLCCRGDSQFSRLLKVLQRGKEGAAVLD